MADGETVIKAINLHEERTAMEAPTNPENVLDRIAHAEDDDGDHTSTRAVVNALGRRPFAPLLILPGLVTLLPIAGIPGVPTVMSALILLVFVQLLFGRQSFWLPDWLLARSVPRSRLATSRRWMLRPARLIDLFLRPRLTFLTNGAGVYLIALISVVIALMIPPMEFVPFSAIGAGLALALLGLALLAHDGFVALLARILHQMPCNSRRGWSSSGVLETEAVAGTTVEGACAPDGGHTKRSAWQTHSHQ